MNFIVRYVAVQGSIIFGVVLRCYIESQLNAREMKACVFDEHIPNSTLITYADVGHIPMEEIPAQSAEDIGTFLTLH